MAGVNVIPGFVYDPAAPTTFVKPTHDGMGFRVYGAVTGHIGFVAPATVHVPIDFVLPDGDGTNGQVLTTDGSHNLSWTTISSTPPYTSITGVPTTHLLGRTTAATGNAEAIAVDSTLTLAGGSLGVNTSVIATISGVVTTLAAFTGTTNIVTIGTLPSLTVTNDISYGGNLKCTGGIAHYFTGGTETFRCTNTYFDFANNVLTFGTGFGIRDTGISRGGAANTLAIGNGTQGDRTGTLQTGILQIGNAYAGNTKNANQLVFYFGSDTAEMLGIDLGGGNRGIQLPGTAILSWNGTSNLVPASGSNGDLGLTRPAANTLAVGNGTAGDASGTLALHNLTSPTSGEIRIVIGGAGANYRCAFESVGTGTNLTAYANGNAAVEIGYQGIAVGDPVTLGTASKIGFCSGTANLGSQIAYWTGGVHAGEIIQGGLDATAPVAQTYRFQSVLGGAGSVPNTAAPNATIILPLGLGTGVGGSLIIQGGTPTVSGTTQQTATTIFTLSQTGVLTCPAFLGTAFIQSSFLYAGASGTAAIGSPGNGILTLWNQTVNGFNRLQFGGITSSFPAIGVSGTTLKFQGADGVADIAITAGAATFSGAITINATTPLFNLSVGGTPTLMFGGSSGAGSIITGSVSGDTCFRSLSSNSFLFSTDNGSSVILKLSGTVATFTGTVQATSYKSSDGSAGATGSASAVNTLTIKNGLVTLIA